MRKAEYSLFAPQGSKNEPEKWAKCKHLDCYYRSHDKVYCDYLTKAGHSRGCPAEECNLYKPKDKKGSKQ